MVRAPSLQDVWQQRMSEPKGCRHKCWRNGDIHVGVIPSPVALRKEREVISCDPLCAAVGSDNTCGYPTLDLGSKSYFSIASLPSSMGRNSVYVMCCTIAATMCRVSYKSQYCCYGNVIDGILHKHNNILPKATPRTTPFINMTILLL